jgi:predicted CxxxxCH...CXXCH cytochrome family protein
MVGLGWAVLWWGGCGPAWPEHAAPSSFALECGHAEAACESCHPADRPLGPVDPACASCHLSGRPDSHDPATTAVCEDCHADSCGWDAAGFHPDGFADPGEHGLAANLQQPTDGKACGECHGADWAGGSARGCDACHTDAGHRDWRTDCTFCHGDPAEGSGAPPQDLDGDAAPASLSFRSHVEHVDADGDYRALACTECHRDAVDALSPGHAVDDTPAEAEVTFEGSIAAVTRWDGRSCSDSYCHGGGQRDDGSIADDAPAPGCDGCHPTSGPWRDMSGYHQEHLEEPGVVCNDCHPAIIDRAGTIVTAPRHVDGRRDVSLPQSGMDRDPATGTCSGTCHGYDHDGRGWGHVPGYDDPELHGVDSNLQALPCGSCHGADWTGGSAIGCDDCHTREGHADWRTDCVFCHGGAGGDTEGVPPQDLDGETQESRISFGAHPEHDDPGGVGHPAYACTECHEQPADALSAGHALDPTPRAAEVDFSRGLSVEAGYDPTLTTCSNLWCHGDGRAPSGVVTDGAALDCDSCHATTVDTARMTGTHAEHVDAGVTCSECHPTVDAAGVITARDRHVDRNLDLDEAGIGLDPVDQTCTLTCHGEPHADFSWDGPHPPGYDDPSRHGQDALFFRADCTPCHGADLRGASADGCDRCHTADWRSDCVYCHGGAAGDPQGMPPSDLDDATAPGQLSFAAHATHVDGDLHPAWDCGVCHGNASRSYSDAWTDPNHWVDSTVGVAEVRFTGSAAGAAYGGGSCTNVACHGNGQVPAASVSDGTTPLDCNGCHGYSLNRQELSGTHALHLAEAGVTCADCHAPVVDAAGSVTTPDRHVDLVVDVDLAATGFVAGTDECTTACHGHDHRNTSWYGGHPAGFDDAAAHGQDALFQRQDCATSGCHGADLQGGGSGQGCDSCHDAGWRSNCTYCHGGENGDTAGLPPQDLDNTTDEAAISFLAHPEHGDADDHAAYGCDECHGAASLAYTDALTDPDHWLDPTPGVAEVSFDGLSPAGTWNGTTCGTVYCHGDGSGTGSVADSAVGLTCRGCHPDSGSGENALDGMSGEHKKHVWEEGALCSDCHGSVVTGGQAITGPLLHVNGDLDVDVLSTLNWNGSRCTGSCHGEGHPSDSW